MRRIPNDVSTNLKIDKNLFRSEESQGQKVVGKELCSTSSRVQE